MCLSGPSKRSALKPFVEPTHVANVTFACHPITENVTVLVDVLLSLVLEGFNLLIKLFMHCPCCQFTRQHQEKSWKCQDSNPGRPRRKRERYHCAMPTIVSYQCFPLPDYVIVLVALDGDSSR